jgi:hypothetical protein
MDAATLYVTITLLNGREQILSHKFPSVAACEERLRQSNNYQVSGRPTRYSCERHIDFSPLVRTKPWMPSPWMP